MSIRDIDIEKLKSLDNFFESTQPSGSIEKALSNNLYGINHQSVKSVLPDNKESYGLVFFTRPQLNLTTNNLKHISQLYNYLTKGDLNIHRYVRNMLDPRLHRGYAEPSISSPLVDEQNGFIPVLSNNIVRVSGWPDIVVPYFTSKQGMRGEQWGIADGTTDIFGSYDMDVVFRNTKSEPIIHMFYLWTLYSTLVFEGAISPYMDYLVQDLIDYNTRIYRLTLDENKRYVTKIACTGASFPLNVPMGEFFDYNSDNKYNDATKEINIRFKCFGAVYLEAIAVAEFNKVSAIFNRGIKELLQEYDKTGILPYETDSVEAIPNEILALLNHRGHPIIDYKTNELRWYINKNSTTYANILNLIS